MTDLVTSERKVFAVGSRHEPVTVVDSVSQTSKKPKPNFRRTYDCQKYPERRFSPNLATPNFFV